jgi:hypothetical protein
MTVVSTQGYLHVIGGFTDADVPSATVSSGVLGQDGSVTEWKLGPPLPIPLWFHNAVTIGGRVWVWGGLTAPQNTSTSAKVFSSPILSSGDLGPWREEAASLPVAFYSAANASAGSFMIAFCPRLSGGATTNDVWFNTVGDQGLGQWTRLVTDLPAKRYLPAAPDYRRGVIYIPGGRVNPQELEEQVFYFTLSTGESAEVASGQKATPGAAASPTQAAGVAPGATSHYTFEAAAASLPADAVPGFLGYEQARRLAIGPPAKPLLLYFNLPNVRNCKQQNQTLQDPQFSALTGQAAFAWINIQDYPQLAHQLGIYKVPTWILYNSRGGEVGRVTNLVTVPQLQEAVRAAQ